MGFFSRLFGKSDNKVDTQSQAISTLPSSAQLLREIIEHVSLVPGQEEIQAKRLAALIQLGPDAIQDIEATIHHVAVHGNHNSEFENAGLLCEAIGRIGGQYAKDTLARFATAESNIWEYRHIRSSTEKALSDLGNQDVACNHGEGKPKRTEGTSPPMTQESIPALLDIAYKQAEEGACIPAVLTFLRAVEIEPRRMISSRVWLNIASVVKGDVPPGRSKNWITLPKELVPEHVVTGLARLPNDSLVPGYPGPYVEPPTETEIRELIADLRGILQRFSDGTSRAASTCSVTTDLGASKNLAGKSEQIESSVMSDDEMVSILSKLCHAYANNDPIYNELEPIATEIGEQLDRRGGISEMRRIFAQLGGIRGARTLEMHWGGIGDWRG